MNWPADRERLATVVGGLGAVVAVLALLFGGVFDGVLRSESVLSILGLIARSLPVVGVVLLVTVLYGGWVRQSSHRSADVFARSRSEAVDLNLDLVGQSVEQRLDSAGADWHRCTETYSISEIQDRLTENAVRVVRTSMGSDRATASQRVERGTWTDDPVAAAFLSPRRGQPLGERLRGALDPGRAFKRRVDRTIAAIEALEDHRTRRSASETAYTTNAGDPSGRVTGESTGTPGRVTKGSGDASRSVDTGANDTAGMAEGETG